MALEAPMATRDVAEEAWSRVVAGLRHLKQELGGPARGGALGDAAMMEEPRA